MQPERNPRVTTDTLRRPLSFSMLAILQFCGLVLSFAHLGSAVLLGQEQHYPCRDVPGATCAQKLVKEWDPPSPVTDVAGKRVPCSAIEGTWEVGETYRDEHLVDGPKMLIRTLAVEIKPDGRPYCRYDFTIDGGPSLIQYHFSKSREFSDVAITRMVNGTCTTRMSGNLQLDHLSEIGLVFDQQDAECGVSANNREAWYFHRHAADETNVAIATRPYTNQILTSKPGPSPAQGGPQTGPIPGTARTGMIITFQSCGYRAFGLSVSCTNGNTGQSNTQILGSGDTTVNACVNKLADACRAVGYTIGAQGASVDISGTKIIVNASGPVFTKRDY